MATTNPGEVNTPSVTEPDTKKPRTHGRVKWFNNKAGYGFISLMEGDNIGQDCFVHHSAIQVNNQQFRYLVEGEYVEFFIIPTNGGTHAFQAGHVSGIGGGKLMCETRYEFKNTRTPLDASSAPDSAPVRSRGEGPRDSNNNNNNNNNNNRNGPNQWSQVKRRGPPAQGPPVEQVL
jgi:CspA family cold shock protein